MDGVKVRFSLSPALDGHQTGLLQSGDQLGDTRPGHAHVLRQPVLPRKTRIVVPGVAQKHGVSDFCAHGNVRVFQDEIRDLGKAALQHGISRVQLQILLFEDFPDCFNVWYDYSTRPENPSVDKLDSPRNFHGTKPAKQDRKYSAAFRKFRKRAERFRRIPHRSE